MAINKTLRMLLKALSYGGIEVHASRRLANLKSLDPMKFFYKKLTIRFITAIMRFRCGFIRRGTKWSMGTTISMCCFFLHGGGWITESVDNYNRVCSEMAKASGCAVVSVEYRLAPEFPFPTGLEDCYAAAKALYTNRFILNVDPEDITLVGGTAPEAIWRRPCHCLLESGANFFRSSRYLFIRR